MISSTSRIASRNLLRGRFVLPAKCRCELPKPPRWSHPKLFQRTPVHSRSFTQASKLSQLSSPTDAATGTKDFTGLAARALPISCPGCGAFSQWVEPEEPGFYNLDKGSVKKYINRTLSRAKEAGAENQRLNESRAAVSNADAAVEETGVLADGEIAQVEPKPEITSEHATENETGALADESVSSSESKQDMESVSRDTSTEAKSSQTQPSATQETESEPTAPLQTPLCERCHLIVNHSEFRPIAYPPMTYISSVMDESPWDHNHVYHIVDAADFPLSVLPSIYRYLDIQKQRTRNRRSHVTRYSSSEKLADLHIIITRSDLLGPTKEKVDGLMQDVMEVLREALGRTGEKVRLGNVNMVSAHKGWWTKAIKEKIWSEGGAVWMVGKTNVGKSKLIETVFPKSTGELTVKGDPGGAPGQMAIDEPDLGDPDALLPPPQQVVKYPVLPLVSTAPGTTASPIRIPFGGSRGEVIDLPGLFRTGLSDFVKDKYKTSLIMSKRLKPERLTIRPGQSLLLDQLIRITPLGRGVVILAASFVPLHPHVTSTDKAVEIGAGQRQYRPFIPDKHSERKDLSIAKDDVERKMKSAGVFPLEWDVTDTYGEKRRDDDNRPLLYRMMSVDILIEGSGWVELVCQYRTRDRAPDDFPKVEVFSPEGKFVGARKSLRTFSFVEEKTGKDKKKKKGRWS